MTNLDELERAYKVATEGPDDIRHGLAIAGIVTALPALAAELRALREFAADMFDASDWPDGGDVDGFEFQELATKHGLLRPEQRTEPCGEDCQCCEVHSEEDMKDGFTCLRKAEWLVALRSVERARIEKGDRDENTV